MAIARAEMDAALKARFVPELRNAGFSGSYPHFRRVGQKYIEIIGIQFSQWGAQFYVELGLGSKSGELIMDGILVPPNKLKHYHAGKRQRVGALPFDYASASVESVAASATATLDQIDKWFRTHGT